MMLDRACWMFIGLMIGGILMALFPKEPEPLIRSAEVVEVVIDRPVITPVPFSVTTPCDHEAEIEILLNKLSELTGARDYVRLQQRTTLPVFAPGDPIPPGTVAYFVGETTSDGWRMGPWEYHMNGKLRWRAVYLLGQRASFTPVELGSR